MKSERGMYLVGSRGVLPEAQVLVTVELYDKWYSLHLIHPDLRVESVPFPDESEWVKGPPFLDHAPNPRHVVHWAKRMGYELSDLALELIHGRFEIECVGNDPRDVVDES